MARRSLGKFAGAGDSGKIQIAEMTMQDVAGKPILLANENVRVTEEAMDHLAPGARLIPFRNRPPIDFNHGGHQRALSAIVRQTASPIILRSLLAAELFPGFAAREGRQYLSCCKLDESSFKAKKCLNRNARASYI
jgi:hypothetical protein